MDTCTSLVFTAVTFLITSLLFICGKKKEKEQKAVKGKGGAKGNKSQADCSCSCADGSCVTCRTGKTGATTAGTEMKGGTTKTKAFESLKTDIQTAQTLTELGMTVETMDLKSMSKRGKAKSKTSVKPVSEQELTVELTQTCKTMQESTKSDKVEANKVAETPRKPSLDTKVSKSSGNLAVAKSDAKLPMQKTAKSTPGQNMSKIGEPPSPKTSKVPEGKVDPKLPKTPEALVKSALVPTKSPAKTVEETAKVVDPKAPKIAETKTPLAGKSPKTTEPPSKTLDPKTVDAKVTEKTAKVPAKSFEKATEKPNPKKPPADKKANNDGNLSNISNASGVGWKVKSTKGKL